MSSEHRVVVVGAGVGGLVCALLLAHQGVQVTLLEAADTPGGKMRQQVVDGAPIDAGPTVLTMAWVFEHIMAAAGLSMAELPALTPLPVLARHAWRNSAATLDLFAQAQRSVDAIAAFSGPDEARRFVGFCDQARRVYGQLEGPYIRSGRPSLWSMATGLGPRGLATLAGLGPFATLWQTLARHFKDPRLQQLFGRYATYCGSSPWQAPATLMLIAQVEMDGVWSVQGGMHALARRLAECALRRGARIRYGSPCEQITVSGGRASGVRLASGEWLAADSVVFNGDPQALAQGLLGAGPQQAVPASRWDKRSLSALTWAVRAPTEGFELERHNVFFDDDYAAEFDDIFGKRRLPRRGTVYLCAQDRGAGRTVASGQAESLLCLVNAPADGDRRPFADLETEPCEKQSLHLMRQCGLQVAWQQHQVRRTTPSDFNQLFPGSGGALYGTATHGWMSPFRRPSAQSRLPGLYLAGGGVHPGPGVPMAALSGQLAAAALMARLDSTSRLRAGATSGGMSTRSVTTGDMA